MTQSACAEDHALGRAPKRNRMFHTFRNVYREEVDLLKTGKRHVPFVLVRVVYVEREFMNICTLPSDIVVSRGKYTRIPRHEGIAGPGVRIVYVKMTTH